MLKKYSAENHGKAHHGWLNSLFHFSFADYYNPKRMEFGALRVVNDDLIGPGTGFGMHPHQDMEIISYVVDGDLTHGDNMGNQKTISRGHIQYMSAGTGVVHSEHNLGAEMLHIFQIWIQPSQRGLKPYYGEYKFDWDLRKNQLLHMVSSKTGTAPVQLNSDANIYALELDKGLSMDFLVEKGRQAYLIQIAGTSDVNGVVLCAKDAVESVEDSLVIKATEKSHLLIIEMGKY